VAVALPELAALAALLACGFLISLYYAYGYSLGAVMQLLAAMFRAIGFHIRFVGRIDLGFVGDAIDGLDHAIRRAIGTGINSTSSGWHYFLHVSAYTLERAAGILEGFSQDAFQALLTLRKVTVPALIAVALAPLLRRLEALERQIATLPHRAQILVSRPIEVVRQEIQTVKSVAVAIPDIRVGRLEREVGALRKRIGELGAGGVAVGLGVVASAVLGRLGLGWARCSNVGRVARHLCGLDRALLDTLLLGSTVIVSSVSLVQLAELMLEVEGELVRGITGGFRELRDLEAG
jgi:hypothetical protein